MTKRKQVQFNVGDRVIHKPRSMMSNIKGALPPRTKLGTVHEVQYKSNARGTLMPWLLIQWDGSSSSEWHMTMRIALAPNQAAIDAVVKNEREKIN
ncbi:MAG: hypothetical protein Unbinned3459contig1000_43 [Prokaryotic dsDNA virus sp.]|jgi:hypothetical protein|nr:MAG: hypothetical protein Unbinned3459contig1000_43 [Prokaryotic dsDNA virus sp.]|tara:strand:+ start:47 stop:334 length:288 start_codon:yes stop_codon:yes gene_type:complete